MEFNPDLSGGERDGDDEQSNVLGTSNVGKHLSYEDYETYLDWMLIERGYRWVAMVREIDGHPDKKGSSKSFYPLRWN